MTGKQRHSVPYRLCGALGRWPGGPTLILLVLRYCHTCDAICWRWHSAEHLTAEQRQFLATLEIALAQARHNHEDGS